MIDPFILTSPPLIHFGIGKYCSIPGIVKQFGDRVLLLTGSASFKSTDSYHSLLNAFDKKGYKTFKEKIENEPSPELIDQITGKYRKEKIKIVVAIGGGSVMDAGKAISAMLPLKNSVMNYLEGVGSGEIHTGEKVPFIAVPTTAGTGSEATKNAVISKVGENGFKRSLRHNNFIPDVAIVDPELTVSCPKEITAYTGMDAFAQLLESYLSTTASRLTDTLCIEGLRRIKNSLHAAVENPENIAARTDMSYAALLSGITLSNAGLGVVHGFASSIGGFFNIPHGVVCGTLMAICNKLTVTKLRRKQKDSIFLYKYARLGEMFVEKKLKSEDASIDAFLELLDDWTESLAMPRLSSYCITNKDFDRIVEATSSKNNPVKLRDEELIAVLKTRI